MNPDARPPRLLFLHLHPSPFVLEDILLLEERYEVAVFHFKGGGSGAERPLRMIFEFVREWTWLMREWPRANVVYGWFADYHLALPVFLSRFRPRPVVVALGGFEANFLPELGYGVMASAWRAPLARFVLRHASALAPVSSSLIETEERFSLWPRQRRNGVRAHVPELRTPIVVIPTGYDPSAWPIGPHGRGSTVCTVAAIGSDRTLKIKGIDLFFEVARLLPGTRFQVVGVADVLRGGIVRRYHPPGNVVLLPARSRQELAALYGASSVYLQLSRSEGLPNVVCEAMLCGSLPVVSPIGGMPDAVGEAGFVVESAEPAMIAKAVRDALNLGADPIKARLARARARDRIVDKFSIAQRRERLLSLLQRVQEEASGSHAPSPP